MDTHPVLVPASSPWLCTPGGTEGSRRWVTGNWPGSLWFLLILAPTAAFSLACVQADCQAAFHRIPQAGGGEAYEAFLGGGWGQGQGVSAQEGAPICGTPCARVKAGEARIAQPGLSCSAGRAPSLARGVSLRQ